MSVPPSRFLPLLGCLASFAVAAARAQAPQQTAPMPGPLPTPVLPGVPNAGPTPEPADQRLVFPNAQVVDILGYYETLSGKHVLYDNTVQGQINIPAYDRITRSEAMHIIEVALNLNGFTLVPTEGNIVKVFGIGKPIRNAGLPIFSELANLPDSEEIVTFLVRLRYLDPQETSQLLTQYIPPTSSIAFTPLPKAGAILITDTARSVRRLVKLLAQLDLPASPVTEKFIPLVRADAAKAVEFLNGVFETKSSGTGANGQPGVTAINPNVRRPIRRGIEDGQAEVPGLTTINPGNGNNGLSSLSGDQLILGRITLTADVRTNRVHVVTSPINMPLVERLLQEYDADTPFATPVRRNLRFRNARDVLPILVQALTEKGDEGSNGSGTTPGGSPSPNRSSSGGSGNLFSNLNSNSSSGSSGGSSGGSSNIGSEGLDTQPVDTTPTEATVGTTKLIADPSSNTIILLGNREAKDKVWQILDQLDVRGAQVIIRTVIGELSLGNGNEFGLNYLLHTKRVGALSQFNSSVVSSLGAATASASASASPSTTSQLANLATLASGLSSGFSGLGGIIAVGKSFDIILSALESTNRFKTVSRPMIFTQNNKKAIIASGQEIAVPTNSVGSTSGTVGGTVGTYTNIDYKSVTLQLEVVPLINSEHEVTLDILQKIDSLVAGGSTVVNGNSVPTIATRYLKSTVSAPNDSTIVLGGLITQDDNRTDNNIPYLGRIPVIGALFRTRSHNTDRSELIILMHPEVVNTPPSLIAAREKEEDRTYLGADLEHQILPLEVRKAVPVRTPTPRPRAYPAPK